MSKKKNVMPIAFTIWSVPNLSHCNLDLEEKVKKKIAKDQFLHHLS